MGWFDELFGFVESSPEHVRAQVVVEGETLRSLANGRRFGIGRLDTPRLAELQAACAGLPRRGPCTRREVVADVRALHRERGSAGAVFQVASQFNLLEMISPQVLPEQGITGYIKDLTQGPACALAAAPATLYRCHLVPVGGRPGQRADAQLDMLADLGAALPGGPHWRMQNGYVLADEAQLRRIAALLRGLEAEPLRGLLRVGVHADVEVVGAGHRVTQVYASALPVSYNHAPAALWEPFARLVLEAAYDATLCAAHLSAERSGCRTVYLTLLGGGAFGNPSAWILDAMTHAAARHAQSGLDIAVVSYGRSQPEVAAWCAAAPAVDTP